MTEQMVLVRGGSGTIGTPVVATLARHRHELGIRVYFDKQRPDTSHVPDVNELRALGGEFCVPDDLRDRFARSGYEVDASFDEICAEAAVVVDCTNSPDGNMQRYDRLITEGKLRRAAANGGANSVHPDKWLFVRGVNDRCFADERKVGIASCNEHAISAVYSSLDRFGVDALDVVLARRGQDIDKVENHPPAPSVDGHSDTEFGTKHARHVAQVFAPLGKDLTGRIHTSAFTVSTPIFHTLRFRARLVERVPREELLAALRENPRISFTDKREANRIFAHARSYSYLGRIYAQTIIVGSTLAVLADGTVAFFAYTPQDANVVLSNVAAVAQAVIPGQQYEDFMSGVEHALIRKVV